MTDVCRSCGAPMRWSYTRTGKPIPLDLDPHPRGSVVLAPISGEAITLRKGAAADPDTPRYMPHFVTCPDANRYRRKRQIRNRWPEGVPS